MEGQFHKEMCCGSGQGLRTMKSRSEKQSEPQRSAENGICTPTPRCPWWNFLRFFRGRRFRRVHPMCANSLPISLVAAHPQECPTEVPSTEQIQPGIEDDAKNGDPDGEIQMAKSEYIVPPVMNRTGLDGEASGGIDDGSEDFPSYYLVGEIMPRRRSKKTEKKLDKIRASFKRVPRDCMSPVEGNWDMNRVFLEETFKFTRQKMANSRGLELVKPESHRLQSWMNSVKAKILGKISSKNKKKDEKKGELSVDEILDIMYNSKRKTKSPKNDKRRRK